MQPGDHTPNYTSLTDVTDRFFGWFDRQLDRLEPGTSHAGPQHPSPDADPGFDMER